MKGIELYKCYQNKTDIRDYFIQCTQSLYADVQDLVKSGRDISGCQIDIDTIFLGLEIRSAVCNLKVDPSAAFDVLMNYYMPDAEVAIRRAISIPMGFDFVICSNVKETAIFYGKQNLVTRAKADFKRSGFAAFC